MLNLNTYKNELISLNINEEESAILMAYIDEITDIAIEYYNEQNKQ